MRDGSDSRVKKTAALWEGVREPFSSAYGEGHREGSDSETLSLLLSLATEKEDRDENT